MRERMRDRMRDRMGDRMGGVQYADGCGEKVEKRKGEKERARSSHHQEALGTWQRGTLLGSCATVPRKLSRTSIFPALGKGTVVKCKEWVAR